MPKLTKTEWALRFAMAFLELRGGGVELSALAQWGEDLWPRSGHLEPEQVAREQYEVDRA